MHAAERCTCPECRSLDRQHPKEGWQTRLFPSGAEPVAIAPLPVDAITGILRRSRLKSSSEAALQASIADAFAAAGIAFEAEVRLSAGSRIDFLAAGGIGIEAKARYARRAIFRQLERYAQHDDITGLILVTGTATGLPAAINGKPTFYVSIGRSAL